MRAKQRSPYYIHHVSPDFCSTPYRRHEDENNSYTRSRRIVSSRGDLERVRLRRVVITITPCPHAPSSYYIIINNTSRLWCLYDNIRTVCVCDRGETRQSTQYTLLERLAAISVRPPRVQHDDVRFFSIFFIPSYDRGFLLSETVCE